MSHWRGQVVSFLSFWAFSMLLVVLLFSRGKAAQSLFDDTALAVSKIASPPAIATAVPETLAEASFAPADQNSGTNTSLASAIPEIQRSEEGSVRRYYSLAERQQIRHATIRVPE